MIKDPSGHPMKQVVLQVTDTDLVGPRSFRALRDDETVNLAETKNREFIIVWVREDGRLISENKLIDDYHELLVLATRRQEEKAQLDRDIDNVKIGLGKLESENKIKTEELRVLRRERDPERIGYQIAEAVKNQTASLEQNIATLRADKANMQLEINELKYSKRKLKEANERLKEGMK